MESMGAGWELSEKKFINNAITEQKFDSIVLSPQERQLLRNRNKKRNICLPRKVFYFVANRFILSQ